jgi:pyruvate dehydrogenase E2 component (dihydrolipoamide acetyltransferase)
MELESYKDGTLLHIGTGKGGKLQVNDLLAILGKQGEDISSLLSQHSGGAAPASKTDEKTAAPAPVQAAASTGIDISKLNEVVLMPRLSDTMTEGVIADWHKKVGDTVKKGDLLADVETDKATMELESYKNGSCFI